MQYRPEFSTATTGIRYVREAGMLIRNGVDVYATRQCLPSGWLVRLMDGEYQVPIVLFFALVMGVYCFQRIAVCRGYQRPIAVLLYKFLFVSCDCRGTVLLLPIVIGQSVAIVDQALILMAIMAAWRGHCTTGSILIAGAASLHIHNAYYLLPVVMFSNKHRPLRTAIFTLALSVFTALGLHLSKSNNHHDYLYTTIGCQLQLHDLSPNLGLWWYMFTEMFDHFRPLFLAVFQLLLVALVVPAAVRLRSDPLFLSWYISSVLAVMRPYPTIADYATSILLLLLQPQLLLSCKAVMQCAAVAAVMLAYLLNVVWYYWMVQGSGNSNFYYAATLAVNAVMMIVTVVITSSWMRGRVKEMNPDLVECDSNVLYQK